VGSNTINMFAAWLELVVCSHSPQMDQEVYGWTA